MNTIKGDIQIGERVDFIYKGGSGHNRVRTGTVESVDRTHMTIEFADGTFKKFLLNKVEFK